MEVNVTIVVPDRELSPVELLYGLKKPNNTFIPLSPLVADRLLAEMRTLSGEPILVAGGEVSAKVHDERLMGPYKVREDRPDMLLLTGLTPQARRLYQIADSARGLEGQLGKPIKVAAGGYHVTNMTLEALRHNIQVVYRGELRPGSMPRLLERLWQTTVDERVSLRLKNPQQDFVYPVSDRSWRKRFGRRIALEGVKGMEGCPFDCLFCGARSVTGRIPRAVTSDCFREEVAALPKGKRVAIMDDNFLPSPSYLEYCLSSARILQEFQKRWYVEVTWRTLYSAWKKRLAETGEDILEKLADSGCSGYFFGFENIEHPQVLKKNRLPDGADFFKATTELNSAIHSLGGVILGAFVIGEPPRNREDPRETPDHWQKIAEYAYKQRLEFIQVTIACPVLGSADFLDAVSMGLISDWNWENWNGQHPVSRHPFLTPDQLYDGLINVYQSFYGLGRTLSGAISDWQRLLFESNRRSVLPIQLALSAIMRNYVGHAKEVKVVPRPPAGVMEQVGLAGQNGGALFDRKVPTDGIPSEFIDD